MTDINQVADSAAKLADIAASISNKAISLSENILNLNCVEKVTLVNGVDPFIFSFTVFIMACFIGYFVVWKVTPALHTPLMSITNAISSIVIIGALIAASTASLAQNLGLFAVMIASINIFGGFIVTIRMLHMFSKKGKK